MRSGFTIVELLIVMVIIGLLAAIAIPKFANTKERATLTAMKSDLRNLVTVEEGHFVENLSYTTDPGSAYSVTSGNKMPTITITPDGWSAVITSWNSAQVCAVYMGSTAAPPAVKEGSPACGDGAAITTAP
ncbi:MAG TPA: prepilin-type N-terminal cleavage/methylation domain-containing protein [Gemmatimonadales bacterium]